MISLGKHGAWISSVLIGMRMYQAKVTYENIMMPTITTFGWVPKFARGFVRDIRLRWAFEEVGQPYEVELISDAKTAEHRLSQPFGQVPTYRDDEVAMFESGAIVVRIAERAGKLIPTDLRGRMQALQWVVAALNSVEPFVMALSVNDIFEADREWSKQRHTKVVEDLQRRLTDLEGALADKRWLDGGIFTVGDLLMISVLGELRGTKVLDRLPKLSTYAARGEARPAYRRAMADHLATFSE
jgi:glutathione S-transferase